MEDLDRQRDLPIMQQQLQLDVGDHVALMGYDSPRSCLGQRHPSHSTGVPAMRCQSATMSRCSSCRPEAASARRVRPLPSTTESLKKARVPTTGWLPGEIVVDRHTLAVPADLSPGRYLLIAALYDPNAPELPRPAVEQDGSERDYVLLEVIDVPLAGSNGTTP